MAWYASGTYASSLFIIHVSDNLLSETISTAQALAPSEKSSAKSQEAGFKYTAY